MKILQVVNKMDAGGIETLLIRLFREAKKSDVIFDFLCADDHKGFYDDEIRELGGEIFYQPKLRRDNPFHILLDMRKRAKAFAELKGYDAIHIHTSQCLSAYFRAKAALKTETKNVIVHSHNTNGAFGKLNNFFRKRLSKLPIKKLACSKEAGEWMFNTPFEIFSNALDMQDFTFNPKIREEMRLDLGLTDSFVVGHVGRLTNCKNQKYLIDIFSEFVKTLADSKLVLVGAGEDEAMLCKLVSEKALEDKVKFLGIRKDVNKVMQAMDVFCFPSIFEGLGIVAIEAQIMGLPCLISDTVPNCVEISNMVEFIGITEADKAAWLEKLKKIYVEERKELIPNSNFASYKIEEATKHLIEDIYTKEFI